MPGRKGLILTRRKGNDTWYIRGTVRGQTVFESTGTADTGRAEAARALREAELWNQAVFGTRATVTFAGAVVSFAESRTLSDAEKKLHRQLLDHFRPTPLARIDQAALDRAYQVILRPNPSPASRLRSVLAPLRAILNHAARRGWCDVPRFEVPSQRKPRVAYLRPAQATALLHAAAPHLRPLLAFLMFTGARMSEALELQWQDVDLAAGRVVFRKTKGGRERHHDLVPAAIATLAALPHRTGHLFQTPEIRNRLGRVVRTPHAYRDNNRQSGGQIKTGWSSACRRAALTGFRPHDLRHTWATWHYATHRDLLKLRNEGGWQSADQVEIYAHLLPDAYHAEVIAILAGTPIERPAKTA